ncbi:ricin-type beta-trefoil lectin domain protein [Streptomyces sp. TRM66268-LWL]|uniref:Ricin-type beta-trefoil lectin domain protein n=1 Tax=Streptomyces polyasparticus TaxID=2767826 RepID=A0ABR7SJ00_9ACTN|nr:RICIN domain-containing protein [Streptomyces polyasparticus]MBC9714446.1 ricin-type beta-trefoil lectin domain protein [Streptomyces polyasparticus]
MASGLAAVGLGLPTVAWAATPDVPEALRISDGPYAGFQQCGAQTPPTFAADNQFGPLFAASVRGIEPQPNLAGTIEIARLGEQPLRTVSVNTGPNGHTWAVQLPADTFSPGDYQWRIRAQNADGPSAWSPWCGFDVTGPATTPTESTYSPDGGKHCLDVSGASKENAARVQLWDCNGSLGQIWKSTPEGTLVNPNSGKCLDVAGGGTANGTGTQIYSCNGTGAQQWRYDQPTAAAFSNPQSGKCLDVPYADFTNGVRVQIHDCNGTAAQVWKRY